MILYVKNITHHRSLFLLLFFILNLVSGCLTKPSGSQTNASTSSDQSSAYPFQGAISAINLNGTQIKLQWGASSDPDLLTYRIYELAADGSLTSIATVAKTVTQYIVASLTPGTFHSFVVRASNSKGQTDSNTNFVSALTYSGVISSSVSSSTSATLVYSTAVEAQYLNIYCFTGDSGAYTLATTVNSASGSHLLTGLTANTQYTCKVLAISPNGTEDSNTATTTFTPVAGPPPPDLTFAGLAGINSTSASTQLYLYWTLGTGASISGYRISRVNSDGSLSLIATVSSSVYEYNVTGLNPLEVYKFQVNAVSSGGVTDTNQVQKEGFTYVGPPVTSIINGTINFPAVGEKVSGYFIQCKLPADAGFTTIKTVYNTAATSDSSFTDSLLQNKVYLCRVGGFLNWSYFSGYYTMIIYTGYNGINGTTDTVTYNSANLHFANINGGYTSTYANGVKIFCKTLGGSYPASPMATITIPGTNSYTLTGLASGRTYTCKAVAYNGSLLIDNSTTTTTFQTLSYGPANYNGVILVQALGDAPTAYVSGMPKNKRVIVNWKYFGTSESATQSYALVRTSAGGAINMTTSTACTSTTTSSCLVCTKSNVMGSQYCEDTNIGGPPNKYDYTVGLLSSDGVAEEFPSSSFSDVPYRINVPIPPENMVLVHRDAANYEMCALMGRTSDPLNHQRCSYSGLGAVPYNSGPDKPALNLPSNYYDFGYNLFIDRWEAGCNWNLTSNTVPSTEGADGDVLFRLDNPMCLIKISNAWKLVSALTPTINDSHRLATYTNSPSSTKYKPPYTVLDQVNSYKVCQAVVDPYYGKKRLLRKREFIAAAAWPTNTGEYGYISDIAAAGVEAGSDHSVAAGTFRCASDNASGITPQTFNTPGYELYRDATYGPAGYYGFTIGSQGTKNCVSRFGAQDMVGNVYEWLSDQLGTCNSTTHICTGVTSTLDNGNIDLNNFKFDGTQGPGGSNLTLWTFESNVGQYFSTPLGLPLLNSDGGNAMLIGSDINSVKLHNDIFYLFTDNTNGSPVARGLAAGFMYGYTVQSGRWATSFSVEPAYASPSIGFRCALPAE